MEFTVNDLISRLSAGRFPGDNVEVLKALGWTETKHWPAVLHSPDGALFLPYATNKCEAHPKPLDDMNAALRLVPEGARTVSAFQLPAGDRWLWTLFYGPRRPAFEGEGPTAAHALTIAILRAKEAG